MGPPRWPEQVLHPPAETSLLLYDGECGLCNALVRYLVRQDRAGRLRVAPLQGATGQSVLRRLDLPTHDFDSLVFLPVTDGAAYSLRSDGALAAVEQLGEGWRWVARAARVVPAAARDAAYRTVARWRHRWSRESRPRPWPRPEGSGPVV